MREMLSGLAAIQSATTSFAWGEDLSTWLASAIAFALGAIAAGFLARKLLAAPAPAAPQLRPAESMNVRVDPDSGPLGSWAAALSAQIPESRREATGFHKLLRAAGLYQPHAANTIYAFRFLGLVVPLLLAGIVAILEPREATFRIMSLGIAAAVLLSVVPRLYVYWRRNRRRRRILHGLPDALDMIGMCMDGGMPLSPALAHVSRQLPNHPELAEELVILRKQAEVSSLKQALADFSDRLDIPETRQLAGMLTRGDRLGSQLTGSLLDQADRLRLSRRQAATREANKAPAKLVFPIMFCLAPAALLLLISPAALELKEFLAPADGRNSILSNNAGMDTSSLLETMGGFDQSLTTNQPSTLNLFGPPSLDDRYDDR